jgi:hypothetical protein
MSDLRVYSPSGFCLLCTMMSCRSWSPYSNTSASVFSRGSTCTSCRCTTLSWCSSRSSLISRIVALDSTTSFLPSLCDLTSLIANVMGSSSSAVAPAPAPPLLLLPLALAGRGSSADEYASALNTMPYVPSPILPRMRYLSVRLSGRRSDDRRMATRRRVAVGDRAGGRVSDGPGSTRETTLYTIRTRAGAQYASERRRGRRRWSPRPRDVRFARRFRRGRPP